MLLRFPPFPGAMEKNVKDLRLLNFFKSVLQKMIEVLGLYKNVRGDSGLLFNLVLVFLFHVENGLHTKKVKISNVSDTVSPIFFNLSPCIWKIIRLLNKNYWNDLDVYFTSFLISGISLYQL